MPDSHNRVAIDRIDWASVLPVLKLVSAFRNALQPGKLIVALIAVLAIHLSGSVLDLMWGEPVESLFGDENGSNQAGVYEALVYAQAASFDELLHSVTGLELLGPGGALGWLAELAVHNPWWFIQNHPWFMLLFGVDVLFVLAMSTGILARMCATQVCASRVSALGGAIGFVRDRWAWYLLTPLMPVMLIVVIGLVLALAGLIFFNVPGLDVVGAVGYGLMLLLGFAIAIVALLLLLALFLMPPALSVEASDGFDAIARSFNYILFRPWQFGVYLFASIAYLAVVYLLVGTVASLSIDAAWYFVGLGVVSEHEPTQASAWIVARWIEFVSAIAIAVLFSTFCCLQTQVYVLMRRSADGTPLDQLGEDEREDLWEKSVNAGAPETNAAVTTAPSSDNYSQPDPPQAQD